MVKMELSWNIKLDDGRQFGNMEELSSEQAPYHIRGMEFLPGMVKDIYKMFGIEAMETIKKLKEKMQLDWPENEKKENEGAPV